MPPAGTGTDIGAIEFGGPLVPISASRKMHGATMFDIDLPLTGITGIECRSGDAPSDHRVIMNFPGTITATSANVTTGSGAVSNFIVNGSQVIVNLTAVANAQTIVLTLFGVSDGTNTSDVSVPMGLLLGDTNGNGAVNATDIGQTKSKSGQPVDASSFRTDVTVSGSINASDVGLVKTMAGTVLP
jgi:hypothetical protein